MVNSLKKIVSSAISLALTVSFVLLLTLGFSSTATALPAELKAPLKAIEECVNVQGGNLQVGPLQGNIGQPLPLKSATVSFNPDNEGFIDRILILVNGSPALDCGRISVRSNTNLLQACGRGSIFLPPGKFIYVASGKLYDPDTTKFCVALD